MKERRLWYAGCDWIWSNPSETVRLLDTLVRRGYVIRKVKPSHRHPHGVYEYVDPEDVQETDLVDVLHRAALAAGGEISDDVLIALAQAARNYFS